MSILPQYDYLTVLALSSLLLVKGGGVEYNNWFAERSNVIGIKILQGSCVGNLRAKGGLKHLTAEGRRP